jgi:antitoxin (DNA-binding transcriptional repressor) of toxin-antitoxin stability system
VRSDPTRVVPATQAQTTLSALLDAAVAGQATHIVRDQTVVAHLVSADTLVLTADIEELLLRPAIRAEAAQFSGGIEKDGYHHAGNTIGRILGWLWESSSDAAVCWTAYYADEVTDALTDRRVARPPFDPFWRAVSIALDIDPAGSPIQDFESDVRSRLPEYTGIFTPSELAGHGRPRDADDPWPDTTARGRCFAKKRWSDVRVGDFVPNHQGADLDYDDGWCRVEQLGAGRAVLRDTTGLDIVQPVDDGSVWLPTRSREPWQWGLPL